MNYEIHLPGCRAGIRPIFILYETTYFLIAGELVFWCGLQ
jgi:hypothetical protein